MRPLLYFVVHTHRLVTGCEAGGHGSSTSPPLFTLLQAVLNVIPDGPPVIAAGGITTGAQVAALLTMGAAGVALGTRFLYTTECAYSDEMKSVLLDANLGATVRSLVFDEMLGLLPRITWPEGIDGRAIANDLVVDYTKGMSMDERKRKFEDGKGKGEKERMLVWAGAGVGLVSEIKSASVGTNCPGHNHMDSPLDRM